MRKPLFVFIYLLCITTAWLSAQTESTKARSFVQQNAQSLHLAKSDFQEMTVNDSYTSKGITHTYFQQQYQGAKVFNALLNVAAVNDRMIISGNRFVADISNKIDNQTLTFSAPKAVENASQHIGLTLTSPLQIISSETNPKNGAFSQKAILSNGGISMENIPAELVWQVQENGHIALCWNVRIYETSGKHWWEIRVNTTTGEVMEKNNWITECNFTNRPHFHSDGEHCEESIVYNPLSFPKEEKVLSPMATNDYNVFDIPIESPNFGSRTVVNSPWNKAGAGNNATSLQWTNDGTTTYTSTRGNNVWAKEDVAGDNETTIGVSATSTTNDFNFPFTPGAAPATYQNAAITNLFYWNNIVHDILYQYGFDEQSGNFQKNNQGRGGVGNDYVLADAQDGSGTNNANFSAPPDGNSGRMQMYLWDGGSGSVTLLVNSPTSISGPYAAGAAAFNPTTPPSTTGNLVLASPIRACSALTNGAQVSGKIAVINRGGCTFASKVKIAQNAGAIGVIIVDSLVSATPPAMGGTDNTITILSCSVTQADGNTIKNAMLSGTVNATINASSGSGVQLDGDLDNGVIAHEYGHGVSNRLTGGPANTSCLGNAEQMGEGWSDYIALMLTTNWAAANKNDVRPIGTYVFGQAPTGSGIREFPYSYNMTLSPYNYDYARQNTEVHALGSAWTAMLWDMTWNIIDMTPASTDIYNGTGGNNIALQLVMEGLKLQPCSPGFVDGRDAILQADELLYGSAHRCAIWAAFARRGLGYSASQGSNTSASDGAQAFDVPQGITLKLTPSVTQIAIGDTITYTLKTQCECSANNNLNLTATLPVELNYVTSSGGTFNTGTRIVSFPSFNLVNAQANTQTIKTVANNSLPLPVSYFSDNVETGGTSWNKVHISGTTVNFGIVTNNAHSPTHAWSIADAATPSENTLRTANPIMIQAGSTLSFWHYHKVEPNYDGGVVEISTNNGTSWTDLGNKMTMNGYNGTIDPATDNVLINKAAFTDEVAMRKTSINLSSFAGQNALFRFRFATDTQNGTMPTATGWFIDDILISTNDTCVYVSAQVGNGSVSDNDATCLPIVATSPNAIGTPSTSGIAVYPNPTHSQLFIELPSHIQKGTINVYNLLGQVVKTLSFNDNNKQMLDVSSLPSAPYLLEVNDGQTSYYQRIMKQD